MINKILDTHLEALSPIKDGATLMVGGFADAGVPFELLHALKQLGIQDLTIISNNAGTRDIGIAGLILNKQVRKIICSHPRPPLADAFANAYKRGEIELECIPQGTLAEKIRATGAGLGPFFTPTGYGTLVAEGKETRTINNTDYVLEDPLEADFALIRAHQADRWGNLTYRWAARNFNPVMSTAANHTIAQCDAIVELGELRAEQIDTQGIYVDSVVLAGAKYE